MDPYKNIYGPRNNFIKTLADPLGVTRSRDNNLKYINIHKISVE